MRLNQGRIGAAESICAAALSLFVGGVFAIDPKSAYANGNLSYLSIPASILLSLAAVILAALAVRRSGCEDLSGLARKTLGRAGGAAFAILLAASFVIAAAKPLSCFTEVLRRLVYDGVSYGSIYLFAVPAAVYAAWKGFESVGRLALIFTGPILVSMIAAVVSAAPEFDTGRLFPFPGNTAPEFAGSVLSGTLFSIPPLAALAVNARGLGGPERAVRYAVPGAFAAAAAAGLAQLAVALIYPPKVLSGLLMPLYRINFLSLSQSYALRLDKLFIMIWLTGCVISTAYLVYSAAYLLTNAFDGRDVTPFVLTTALLTTAFSSLGFTVSFKTAETVTRLSDSWGFLLAAAPLLTVSVLGSLRKGGKKA